jgi:hypothetical protein
LPVWIWSRFLRSNRSWLSPNGAVVDRWMCTVTKHSVVLPRIFPKDFSDELGQQITATFSKCNTNKQASSSRSCFKYNRSKEPGCFSWRKSFQMGLTHTLREECVRFNQLGNWILESVHKILSATQKCSDQFVSGPSQISK